MTNISCIHLSTHLRYYTTTAPAGNTICDMVFRIRNYSFLEINEKYGAVSVELALKSHVLLGVNVNDINYCFREKHMNFCL